MALKKQKRLPCLIALIAVLFSISITRNIELWKTKQIIQWNVISYYAYLPAAFIYNDLTLNFMDNYNGPHEFTMWPKTANIKSSELSSRIKQDKNQDFIPYLISYIGSVILFPIIKIFPETYCFIFKKDQVR